MSAIPRSIEKLLNKLDREGRMELATYLATGTHRYGQPVDLDNMHKRPEYGEDENFELAKPQIGIDTQKIEKSVRLFFEAIGDDPNRDGIKDTPKRVAKMYSETMNGFFLKPEDFVTTFENDGDYYGPIILRDAEFYTVCEHHLQPFAGTIDIAYEPGERIVGLSKLLRVARVYAKRPQVQERLTRQVADALNDVLKPLWLVVRIRAEHHCMKLRGVRISGSSTETIYGYGGYPNDIFRL